MQTESPFQVIYSGFHSTFGAGAAVGFSGFVAGGFLSGAGLSSAGFAGGFFSGDGFGSCGGTGAGFSAGGRRVGTFDFSSAAVAARIIVATNSRTAGT